MMANTPKVKSGILQMSAGKAALLLGQQIKDGTITRDKALHLLGFMLDESLTDRVGNNGKTIVLIKEWLLDGAKDYPTV